ncbi:SDR family NAD(P)-dependent oxidoreductase [Hymenobacter properus]|uniref:SDR family oxidoreductase n=1 Tax=Hymenobacter properus TaxID=2791026 RepID=A0A931BJE5_9BACT|nr:SDR family oxidoreductase [Hymenobacter properus]MBF9143378.1 SDR family oxidoreductase [Hymenobacter properus]MBR7722189.1 SDR family oxidoreductase [Microvirga sp. SRT04]
MATQQTALITGASSGIGRELANCFAQDKYNLILVALEPDLLNQAASELRQQYGVEVTTIVKDLFKRDAPFEVYNEVKQQGRQIDVLVNDAGQGQYGTFDTTDINRELDIIQLNIGAYVVFTKLYLKEFKARNEGKILFVGSIAGELPGPLQAVYHGTKAFVNSFVESIQEENKDTNITLTNLLPGITKTDFFNKAHMTQAKNVAEGQGMEAADVAKEGYKALMKGENRIIAGVMNNVQVGFSKVMPDPLVAAQVHQQSKPVDGDESAR